MVTAVLRLNQGNTSNPNCLNFNYSWIHSTQDRHDYKLYTHSTDGKYDGGNSETVIALSAHCTGSRYSAVKSNNN